MFNILIIHHSSIIQEYLVLEVTNDLVFNKLVQEMNSGNIKSISIPVRAIC